MDCVLGRFVRKQGMFLGYASVSTTNQDAAPQRGALAAAGCARANLGRQNKLTGDQAARACVLLASGEDGRTVARSVGVARSTRYADLKTSDQPSVVSRIV